MNVCVGCGNEPINENGECLHNSQMWVKKIYWLTMILTKSPSLHLFLRTCQIQTLRPFRGQETVYIFEERSGCSHFIIIAGNMFPNIAKEIGVHVQWWHSQGENSGIISISYFLAQSMEPTRWSKWTLWRHSTLHNTTQSVQ